MMLVMPVSPRPHQGSDKIESAVSDSLRDIETVIIGSARKIEHAIEETVRENMSQKIAATKERGAVVSDINKAAFRNVLAKIFARKRASAMKADVPSVPRSVKDGTAATSTTTLDPLAEYCKEACEAGVGGPECDCPDHPIG